MKLPLVLLVEDDPDDVYFFKWALGKLGPSITLEVAEHGQKAIDYLAGSASFADRVAYPKPDFVVLDLKLPYKSGFEVLEWIRGSEEYADLPVAILTGSNEERDLERAKTLRATAYLVKPAEPEDLRLLFEQVGIPLR